MDFNMKRNGVTTKRVIEWSELSFASIVAAFITIATGAIVTTFNAPYGLFLIYGGSALAFGVYAIKTVITRNATNITMTAITFTLLLIGFNTFLKHM